MNLPKQGQAPEDLLKQLQKMHSTDSDWHSGKTWSLVYHAGDEHTEFLKKVYSIYFHQNGLNPGAFPSLKKMEAEVVAMSASMFNGNYLESTEVIASVCGTMTSGGSESVMMAVKTYRDRARVLHPEITAPEMIAPQSVHPAFDKAAHYFGVRLLKASLDSKFQVDVTHVRSLIGPNTILLVGSAPQYPQGVLDPIEELSTLALEKGIGLHVDACLGGFFIPFLSKKIGKTLRYDFTLPGVTSLSADLHKYGFSAKGASVILYRDAELRKHQFFVSSDWPGGLFASPSMTGTRPAGAIAAAWASLLKHGQEGYEKRLDQILNISNFLQAEVRALGFEILGSPLGPVFAFRDVTGLTYAIADQMEFKGWHIDRQQHPESIHLMITPAHAESSRGFIADLKMSCEFVRSHPETLTQGKAAMYGMMAQIPDGAQIHPFLYQYMEERYQPPTD